MEESVSTVQKQTVTVTRRPCGEFVIRFSRLPGQTFGPWEFAETVRDLTVSALLEPIDARNLVIEASVHGSATTDSLG